MQDKAKGERRDRIGFGSSYRRGSSQDLRDKAEIGAVLGGQVWMIKPDKDAKIGNPCLWMRAGVVKTKDCNNFYDCTTCKYDQGMRKQVESGKQMSWQDAMRKRPSLERICRHSLTERIARRVCAYDYECPKCDFDQFFEDVWCTKTKTQPNEMRYVRGFGVPAGYYFHNGHTWARIESGGYLRVGMDEFALKTLGRADALDLPTMGKELSQATVGWGLKRRENHASVLSPVDGVIVEVNAALRETPGAANQEPFGKGWLFVVRNPDLKGTVKKLMDDKASLPWMSEEVRTLEHMIEAVAGPLAADGGTVGDDVYGHLPGLGWKNLTKTFLKTE
jgi:glycine cleavage system H lipoate-binding protein